MVAACHGRVRCLSCRRSGHRERDCWQRKKAAKASAPVYSGLPAATAPTCSSVPAVGSRRRPLDCSWASIAALPAVHEDNIHAQPTANAAAASSATPPDAMLKSVLAEQAKLLRAELQGLATLQLEELVKPVRDVSKSMRDLLDRLGSMLERAAGALEGHSLAPSSVQISPMQHALTEVGFATMPNQLEMFVNPVVRSDLEELKEHGAPCSGENLLKEMIEVDAPQKLVGQPVVPSISKELKDTGATFIKKALGIPVFVDVDAVVVIASTTADEAIDGKALGKSDVVGEQCLFGCLSPRASPSPQPDVPVPFERDEDIDGIMPVIQIMPDLQELCEDRSPPLSLVHLQVDSLATLEVASTPPPMEACRSGGNIVEEDALVLGSSEDLAVATTPTPPQPEPCQSLASLDSRGVLAASSDALFAKELCGLLASLEAACPGYGKDIACVLAGKASETMIRKVEKSLKKVIIRGKGRKRAIARKPAAAH